MTALKEVGDRIADAARLRAASGLMLAAASLHVARLADHLAAGRMTPADALAAALVVEAAALSVPNLDRLECPHEHRRVSL